MVGGQRTDISCGGVGDRLDRIVNLDAFVYLLRASASMKPGRHIIVKTRR